MNTNPQTVDLSKPILVEAYNPIHRYKDRKLENIKQGMSLTAVVAGRKIDSKRAFIVAVNGEPKLRATWDGTIIKDKDFVVIWHLPAGGGKKNPLLTIIGIALIAVGVGIALATTAVALGIAVASIGVAVLAVGLLGIPDIPSVDLGNQLARPSPTYTLDAQGNRVRMGEAIPVIYGKHRVFPDFGSKPYQEYDNNAQFLNHILVLGQGEYEVSDVKIGDESIDEYEEITWQKVDPGDPITLEGVDDSIRQSEAVTNQVLVGSNNRRTGSEGWVGDFNTSELGRGASEVHIDIVFPRGLYTVNEDGGASNRTASWQVQVRAIRDQSGGGFPQRDNVNRNWRDLASETLTQADTTPIRRTYKYTLPGVRNATDTRLALWEVRVRKTSEDLSGSTAGQDQIQWQALKAKLNRKNVLYDNATLLVVRMQATNQLTQQNSRRINVVASRKIRRWNATASSISSTLVETSRLEDVLLDLLTDTEYGGSIPIGKIDLPSLRPYPPTTHVNLVGFNGVFDRQMSLWEALKLVCRAVRSIPLIQAGVIRVVRDQYKATPVAMFSARNIVKNSFRIDYQLPTEYQYDGIEIEYIEGLYELFRVPDESRTHGSRTLGYGPGVLAATWKPAFARATRNTVLTNNEVINHFYLHTEQPVLTNPAKIKLFGCTNYQQAKEEAIFMAKNAFYRRTNVKFETELEGYIPSVGDLVLISHPEFDWGQNGDIIGWIPFDGNNIETSNILMLSNEVELDSTKQNFIVLRDSKGVPLGPHPIVAVSGKPNQIRFPYTLTQTTNFIFLQTNANNKLEFVFRESAATTIERTTLSTGLEQERTQFAIGVAGEWSKYAVIKSVTPRGEYKVAIEATLEDDRVHGRATTRQ